VSHQCNSCPSCDVVERLARIDERLENLEHQLLGNGQPGRCAIHEKEITSLILWRSRLAGALAIVGVLWGASVAVAAAYISAKLK